MNKKATTLLFLILALGFVSCAQDIDADDNAADALISQIQSMANAVRDEQAAHTALWDSQQVDCTNEIGFRNSEVNDANVAYANSQVALNNCENALANSQADVAQANGYIDDVNRNLDNLEVQRSIEHNRYLTILNEQLNPAIDAVNGVYAILEDFENSGNPSFVQLLSHINKSFVHFVKAQKTAQFAPIFAQVLSTQSVGVSADVIAQLYNLFNKLGSDLSDAKELLEETEQAQLDDYNARVAAYNVILDNLNATLADLANYIDQLDVCIQTEEAVSASAQAKSERNGEALEHAVEMCSAFATEYENSTSARNDEIALLQKLQAFIEEQADIFGEFGNDGVNAFEEYQKSFAQSRASVRSNFLQVTLKKYNSSEKVEAVPSKCTACRKSFLQKKLGF